MKLNLRSALLALAVAAAVVPSQAADQPHSVVLFVADGMRALMANNEIAPTMSAIRDSGVWFKNSHALFPTFTMPNSSALATGHYLGDTGDFGNTIYTGIPIPNASGSVTPFLENDAVLGDVDEHFAGNYLNEEAVLAAARRAGFSTAAVGKLGPIAIQDVTERSGEQSIVVDDSTGRAGGIPLAKSVVAELEKAGLAAQTPSRGDNGKSGNATTPGALVANIDQQNYFVDVTTKVILPRFKSAGKPFVLVFWSRDPDGTQHNHGDSLGQLVPGINGPTSLASIKNSDDNLAAIKAALESLGLDKTTNIVVTADHGFSTISKQSKTSAAAKMNYADVAAGQLPPGFLAIDLAQTLSLALHDPDAKGAVVDSKAGHHPSRANGLIGRSAQKPDVVVAANGGSDLVYLPQKNAKHLAPKVVKALLAQDYVSGLFVDDALGKIPGTLPLSAINLKGSALTPVPAIVVNFRSEATGCSTPVNCTAEVADTGLQQGQGMHGSFSRADTYNFMAAIGPDFKTGYVDEAPVSNADVGKTIAAILKLDVPDKGMLVGRVMSEAMPGGKTPAFAAKTLRSAPSAEGLRTVLKYQVVGATAYYGVAGFPGRSVGLEEQNTSGAPSVAAK